MFAWLRRNRNEAANDGGQGTGSKLTASFERIISLLNEASRLSEDEVTVASEGVSRFYEEACEHSTALNQPAADLTADKIPELSEVSPEFSGSIAGQLREQMAALDASLESLELIRTLAGDMEALTRSAKLMGVNLRIEAARLGEAGRTIEAGASSWADFADDMAELNGRVAKVTSEMLENFPRAHRIATAVLDRAEAEQSRCDEAYGELQSRLDQQQQELAKSTQAAAAQAQRIRDAADQVLTRLQFQDRMRQLHAHMERDLREVADTLEIPLTSKPEPQAPVMSDDVDATVESGELEFF